MPTNFTYQLIYKGFFSSFLGNCDKIEINSEVICN